MTFNQAKVIIVGAVTTEMTAAMERARQGIPDPSSKSRLDPTCGPCGEPSRVRS
jgi:hypothetical protein